MSTRRGGSNDVIPSTAAMIPGPSSRSRALDYTSVDYTKERRALSPRRDGPMRRLQPAGGAGSAGASGRLVPAWARYRLAMSRKHWMSAFCVPEK